MTPALKAMVEAMAAELVRQDGSDQGRANYSDVDDFHDATLDGHYDLEKVARAALAALVPPDAETMKVFDKHDDAAANAHVEALSAVLGEPPSHVLWSTGWRARDEQVD